MFSNMVFPNSQLEHFESEITIRKTEIEHYIPKLISNKTAGDLKAKSKIEKSKIGYSKMVSTNPKPASEDLNSNLENHRRQFLFKIPPTGN